MKKQFLDCYAVEIYRHKSSDGVEKLGSCLFQNETHDLVATGLFSKPDDGEWGISFMSGGDSLPAQAWLKWVMGGCVENDNARKRVDYVVIKENKKQK